MADRSVVVRLRAEIAGFQRAMKDAADSVRNLGGAGQDSGDQTASMLDRITKSATENKQQWEQVGHAMLITGGVIGAGVGLAVKAFADFDKEMSQVRAVSGAGSAEMEKLSAAAIKAGADTKFSASEAAQATGELAKVGISTADILGGALSGSLDLAAAGNLDLADAAMISGQAMKLFNLQGKDVGHIADVLAAGANKSAADVTDLAQALSQGGLVAAQTGLTLDDTVGTLSAFADNALLGSDAGTSFKTMLQRLNPQSAEAQKLMDQLGLSAYDAQGNFVGITAYAGKLQAALGTMSVEQRNAAMQTLFGSDAVRAANVLYKLGADGVQDYVSAVNDQGAAARVAAINMDNLSGDVEQLKGSLDTLLIQGGSGGNGPLRQLVQSITGVVNAIGSLPQPVLDVGLGMAAFTSAVLLAGGAALTIVPKVVELRAAMTALGVTSARTSAILKGIGAAGVVVGVAAVAGELIKLSAEASVADVTVGKLADSIDSISRGSKGAGAFGDLFDTGKGPFKHEVEDTSEAMRKFADSAQQALGTNFGDRIERWGSSSYTFNKRIGEIDAAMAQMVGSGNIDGAAKMYGQLMDAIKAANEQGANIPVDQVAEKFKKYQAAIDAAKASTQGAIDPSEQLGGSIDDVQFAAKDAADAVDKLVQSLADAGLVQLSAREATRGYKQAIDDAAAALKKNGKTLDDNTQKGRDNEEALDNVAQATIRSAQATYDRVKATDGVGPAEEAFRSTLTKSRAALVATARSFGMSKADAEAYADKVLAIPAVRNTKVTLSGATAAITEATRIAQAIAKIPGRKTTDVVVRKIGAQGEKFSADGGLISGPGGPRDDAIPAMLSDGEFVVNAAATSRHRSLLESINGQKFANGGLVRKFATGGSVTKAIDAQYQKAIRLPGAEGVQAAADAITRLLAAWQKSIDDADTAARRLELVRAVAKASRKDVAEARKALADFDRDQTRERIKSAAAAKQELLASRAKALQDRQADADKHASDLNRMLDERTSILGQLSQAQATYDATVAATNARLADQTRQLEDTRRAALESWASLTEQATVGFAPSMAFIVNNAKDQVEQFTEWMSQLSLARSRGLSESAIAMLGLDSGPQALAQLRQVNKGTADQLDDLNALVAQRNQLAQQQTDTEATNRLGKLGQDLLALQQEATQAIADAQASFMEQQQALTEQLAAIGTDQARSYTDAIAEGLLSGIPAIEAAAAQVQAALTKLGQQQAALTAATKKATTKRAGGGWVFGPGSSTSDEVALMASNGEFVVNAAAARRNAALLTAINAGRTVTAGQTAGVSASSVNVAAPQVHVYVDGQEFRGLVRVELGQAARQAQMAERRTVGA